MSSRGAIPPCLDGSMYLYQGPYGPHLVVFRVHFRVVGWSWYRVLACLQRPAPGCRRQLSRHGSQQQGLRGVYRPVEKKTELEFLLQALCLESFAFRASNSKRDMRTTLYSRRNQPTRSLVLMYHGKLMSSLALVHGGLVVCLSSLGA